ncbi:hypothetical protein FQN57_004793 [Myotisia sp. PD_48]|nr:hypothetical protein FQN57_004793 [Myotisia sp. PD_48]
MFWRNNDYWHHPLSSLWRNLPSTPSADTWQNNFAPNMCDDCLNYVHPDDCPYYYDNSNLYTNYEPEYTDTNTNINYAAAPAQPEVEDDGYEDETKPDVLHIHHMNTIYSLEFPPFAIGDELLTIGEVRMRIGSVLLVTDLHRVRLLYKGRILKHNDRTAKSVGLKQHSKISCVVLGDLYPGEISSSEDSEMGDWTRRNRNRRGSPAMNNGSRNQRRAPSARPRTPVSSDSFPSADDEAPPRPLRPSRTANPTIPTSNRNAVPHPVEELDFSTPPSTPRLSDKAAADRNLAILTKYFRSKFEPYCRSFISCPPRDAALRRKTYDMLGILATELMMTADSIALKGSETLRLQRKDLIDTVEGMVRHAEEISKR